MRVSVYTDDRLTYSLGTPIPLDMTDVDIRKRSATYSNIEGSDGERLVGREEDKLYFFSKVKSDDGKVTVCTAMPYSDNVHDAIENRHESVARDSVGPCRNPDHRLSVYPDIVAPT
ncbi:hypothetical protein [Duncaniella dubosii]|uniref:hypothetical protein n=1 Tax=Duncaniella dubosii TaxID=2518971 RepID=UPI003F6687A5